MTTTERRLLSLLRWLGFSLCIGAGITANADRWELWGANLLIWFWVSVRLAREVRAS